MVWFKVDDSFYSSRKVVRIPRAKRSSAIGLWLIAGTWCANNLTDGRIEQHELDELGGRKTDAEALVTCGLWERTDTGYQFHNWTTYQPTKAAVLSAREKEAERKRVSRGGKADAESGERPAGVRADKTRTPGGQNAESGHPVPSRPSPSRPDPTNDGYDTQSSPVPNRETETGSDGGESLDQLVARQAMTLYGVEYGKVRTAIAKACNRVPNPSDVLAIIAGVHERAHKPIKSPTGVVIISIRNDWAEWQKYLDTGAVAS